MMPNRIPPQYLWPGLVVALLVFTVMAQLILLVASQTDGGAQIEEDFYQRSLNWENLQTLRTQSQRRGWTVSLHFGLETELTVMDAQGQPVRGLEGVLELRRPDYAGVLAEEPLTAVPGKPGVYRSAARPLRPGLWDFTLRVRSGGQPILLQLRREV